MAEDGKCICCEKEIFEEQDYTTLICHAAGQTISHTTLAHDKCWEKFKKSFVRGRGTSSRTQTFFCPVAGCHNALQHQHLSVRKKTHGSGSAGPTAPKKADGLSTGADVADSYTALPGLDGAPRLPSKQVGGANRLSRHEAEAEEEQQEEDDRCQAFKADGTRCGRPVFDAELGACRLHVDSVRRQREFAKKAAEEALERERQIELELAAARERAEGDEPDFKLDIDMLLGGGRSAGIGIEIGEGPTTKRVDPVESAEEAAVRAAAAVARAQAAAELKPAPWAAAIEGINQKKGWNAAIDKTDLEDCPVCLEEKADVKMDPCGHTCCGGCLDQWMSQKSSFAQTLRNGSSDTTCPLCRAAVTDTVAATPVEGTAAASPSAAPPSEAEDEVKDWMALAKQRHAEVVAKARAMRGDPSVSDAGQQAESAQDAVTPKTEPKPSNASKWGISSVSSNGFAKATPWGTPNGTSWSIEVKHGGTKASEDRGARNSDGADVDAMLGDVMQARLAAVIDDEDTVPLVPALTVPDRKKRDDPWTQEEKQRRKEHEEAKAHAAWMKAQANAAAKSAEIQGAQNERHASQGVQARSGVNSPEPADEKEAGGVAKRPAANEGWGADFGVAFHSGFGGGFGGGAFGRVPTKEDEARLTLEEEQLRAARREAAQAREVASRANAHVDSERQAADMLRTELASIRDQLVAEQEARAKDHQRAEQAEATVEVLKQQLTAFQEQLNRMRKAERAKDEEYRRLQDEHRSLARAQEEAKASVMKMWDQLEKKDQEVDALKSKLPGGQQSHMQGGPPGQGGMRGLPPGQINGYSNHPGMMQRPPHMQPQSMPRAQPHMQPRPQHPGQFGALPHNGAGPARTSVQAAAQVMQRGWKCAHCTFLNQNAPILDPHTKQHKGFCEICEGVTTLFGTS